MRSSEFVSFIKMHGLGNDMLLIPEAMELTARQVALLCDRRFGVGADELMTLDLGPAVPVLRFWNADGTPSNACGNGTRCAFRYADTILSKFGAPFVLSGPVGHLEGRVLANEDVAVVQGNAEVGWTSANKTKVPCAPFEEQGRTVFPVWIGNAHAVVERASESGWTEDAQRLCGHSAFPDQANVSFVERLGPFSLKLHVYERGAGVTQACATAACAAVAALIGFSNEPVSVHMPGGVLKISWTDDGRFVQTGPAETVFEGRFKKDLVF